MDELTQRFIESYNYLKDEKVISSDTDFANNLSISRSLITEILKGRSKAGTKALQNIVKNYGVNATWLLIGEGQMLAQKEVATPNDKRLPVRNDVVILEGTPNTKKGITTLKTTGNTTSSPNFGDNITILSPQIISVDRDTGSENILHVNAKVAAGYLTGYADREYMGSLPSFNLPGLTDATYRSFEVTGDSMHPTLKSGQMVIGRWVEKLEYIRDDRVYIIVHKTLGIVVKRLINRIERDGVIYAKSDATNDRELYKTYPIRPDEIQELWYAVFHGGFDFQSPSDMWKRLNNNEADLVSLENTVKQLTGVLKEAGLLK